MEKRVNPFTLQTMKQVGNYRHKGVEIVVVVCEDHSDVTFFPLKIWRKFPFKMPKNAIGILNPCEYEEFYDRDIVTTETDFGKSIMTLDEDIHVKFYCSGKLKYFYEVEYTRLTNPKTGVTSSVAFTHNGHPKYETFQEAFVWAFYTLSNPEKFVWRWR